MPNTKLHLGIDSHVVVQLGAELISDSEQALLELVKNSYDGDASRCTISIEPDWTPPPSHPWADHFRKPTATVGRIVVEDDGVGLSENAVKNGWLVISASLKRAGTEGKVATLRGRTPVGDKGLGRLATMRLGDVLLLTTKTVKEKHSRSVSFAWSAFKSGRLLDEIPVKAGIEAPLRGRSHGTNVEILGLNEATYWDSAHNVQSVVATLSSLITPFRKLQDFNVTVRYDEQRLDLRALTAEVLNHASAMFRFDYVDGKLSMKAFFAKPLFRGQSGAKAKQTYERLLADRALPAAIKYFKSQKRLDKRGFKDLSETPSGWLFSLEDNVSWEDLPRDPKLPGATDPGPFTAEIHYFLFNEPTKAALQASGVPVEMLQNMTSVGMFRDGFRVRMDDDWLDISRGVTSGGFFQLRPKNVIGFFEISNKVNPALIEKSDRESFVDNSAWRGLRLLSMRAVKLANDALEATRTTYEEYKKESGVLEVGDRNLSTAEQSKRILESGQAASASLVTAQKRSAHAASRLAALSASVKSSPTALVGVASELQSVVEEIQSAIEAANREADAGFVVANNLATTNEMLSQHNLRLIDAAAVGLSARALTHELNTYISQVDKGLASVRRANKSRPDKRLDDAIERIGGAIRELRKSISSINPLLSGSRSLKDSFSTGEALRDFADLRKSRLEEAQVQLLVSKGAGPTIRFSRTRFNQVLENLLQNSLYWLHEYSSHDGVKLEIHAEVDSKGFTWWDGGKGVRESVTESLFEAYVTDKPHDRGQGLGLFLVTAFLESEKCQITLLDERNSFGRRYKFRVDLRGAISA